MRAIIADDATTKALRAKVDAAYGYPRCDRLSRTLVYPTPETLSCGCKDARSPDLECPFTTRAQALPVALKDGTFAYPVNEAKAETIAALTKAEAQTVVTVDDAAVKVQPIAAAAQPIDAQAAEAIKP